jgi:hypothetical protein
VRAIFGVLSLIVVLAIVGSIAKKQLQAVGLTTPNSSGRNAAAIRQSGALPTESRGDRDGATFAIPGGMPGAVAADPNGLTVPQQARNMQEQARVNTQRALEQGMQRNRQADR